MPTLDIETAALLDTVKAGGQVPDADFEIVASRISFFVRRSTPGG